MERDLMKWSESVRILLQVSSHQSYISNRKQKFYITEGVVVFHNGSFHPNNSIINEDEIGEGAMSVLCFTNKLDCCGEVPLHTGEWYFPNKSRVRVQNEGVIYRDRHASVVRLNWRYYPNPPTGVFHCQIPDINGTIQNVYVGVHPRNAGMHIILLQ